MSMLLLLILLLLFGQARAVLCVAAFRPGPGRSSPLSELNRVMTGGSCMKQQRERGFEDTEIIQKAFSILCSNKTTACRHTDSLLLIV